jgi:hypothetical protein
MWVFLIFLLLIREMGFLLSVDTAGLNCDGESLILVRSTSLQRKRTNVKRAASAPSRLRLSWSSYDLRLRTEVHPQAQQICFDPAASKYRADQDGGQQKTGFRSRGRRLRENENV